MTDDRPTWDETWLALADLMAARSLCPSGVGAVIVDARNRIVDTGYTGPPRDWVPPVQYGHHSGPAACARYCYRAGLPAGQRDPLYLDCPTVHGEQNAIAHADRTRMDAGTFYISSSPCWACTKLIANTGIVRVVWRATEYDASTGRDPESARSFFAQCGIEVNVDA
jgi:dCMP deaminase